MPDDDEFYLDEPSRPVGPLGPYVLPERFRRLGEELAAEFQAAQEAGYAALKTGKRSARVVALPQRASKGVCLY